jgi:hypothetical protein
VGVDSSVAVGVEDGFVVMVKVGVGIVVWVSVGVAIGVVVVFAQAVNRRITKTVSKVVLLGNKYIFKFPLRL